MVERVQRAARLLRREELRLPRVQLVAWSALTTLGLLIVALGGWWAGLVLLALSAVLPRAPQG